MKVSGLPAVSKVWNFGSHAPRGLASPWPRTGGRTSRPLRWGEPPGQGHGGCWKPRVKRCPVIFQLHPQKRPLTFPKFQESELFWKQNLTTSLKFIVPSLWVFLNFPPPPPEKKIKKSPLTNFPQRHHMAPPKRAWAEFP